MLIGFDRWSHRREELFLISGSIHSSLRRPQVSFIRRSEGRQNIDKYAFAFGSIHYPFHQEIPSLDYFASDHQKIHTFRGNMKSTLTAAVTKLGYLTHDF
jgi:hypothetical protein